MMKKREELFTRLGRLGEDDGIGESYKAWEEIGTEAKFAAAWELVVQAYEMQGKDLNELRFQRSATRLFRK